MTIKYKTYEKFGNILVNNILGKITGVHPDFERIAFYEPPSENILIGTLGGSYDESNTDETKDVKFHFEKESNNDSIFPNSLSVKFLLDKFTSEMTVDLSFNVFYRVYPTYEEQLAHSNDSKSKNVRFFRVWKRKNIDASVNFDKSSSLISLSDVISKYIEEIKKDPAVLREDRIFDKEKYLESEEIYNKFVENEKTKKFPDLLWDVKLQFKNREFIQKDEKFDMVEISLINDSPILKEKYVFDFSIFSPILNISLGDNVFKQFNYLYPRSSDEYYQADLRCLNCQGDYNSESNSIVTRNFGSFDQYKVAPKNGLEGVDISFNTLSTEKGFDELEKIYNLMNDFFATSSKDNSGYDDFNLMKERFKSNIDLMRANKDVAQAFYLMNETFEENSKNSSYHSWRLFQIVFIVSQLKDIALNEERDTCELLHVMTGGGKSETYFGIVVFTAFFDRISGKEFGISGVTKFPLRMLSVQQLQRISNIFIFAEKVRKLHQIGGDHFSIAYFVGSQDSDFPSHNYKFIRRIRKAKEEDEYVPGHIIDKCPLCGGDVYLDIDEDQQLIIHKCDSCNEEFRLYFSDDEIYRTLPTFIVSTVDKWAGISANRRIRNLLGGKLERCIEGHGFIPAGDTCGFQDVNEKICDSVGDSIDIGFDTSPTLIIQDEMHLIRESFGTIDSHFETTIENMKSEFSNGSKFKNIVMTATVSGADNQIEHLYHKSTRVFPPSLENSKGESFFFNQIKEDGEDIIQRRIIGLKSSIQNFKLIFHILKYASQFFKELDENFEIFAKDEGFDENELKVVNSYYRNLLTYHNKKEAVHSVSYSVDDYVNIYDNLYHVFTEPLTGENSLDDIKDIISKVEHFHEDKTNEDKILCVNATSIVSHGVDIDEWNCMVFDGMPRSTSEYIQALSRVGRKYFGIVFVSFSPLRTRDISYYQHFEEYHKILDYKVEDVPLSRWAKLGFKQTFTSIFNAGILNYLSNELEIPLFRTAAVINILSNEENKNKLAEFIRNSYVTYSTMKGSEFFDDEIEEEIEKRIEQLKKYPDVKFFPNALAISPNKYFRIQRGMRGIQDNITLVPSKADDHFRAIYRGG